MIAVKDVPGFYVNRCLAPMLAEVFPLFEDGVTPGALDKAMKSMGMPVGPVTLIDEVGADVGLHVTETMVADPTMGCRMNGADPVQMKAFVDNGWLGKKSGKGFFMCVRSLELGRARRRALERAPSPERAPARRARFSSRSRCSLALSRRLRAGTTRRASGSA